MDDGKSPYIGANGNWWVWDDILGSYVDSGDPAQEMMVNHHIGANGNWWVWDGSKYGTQTLRLGGDDGKSPYIGENGNWYVWDDIQEVMLIQETLHTEMMANHHT